MTIVPILQTLAKKYRLDPQALIAVARGEGGLVNRPNDVGDLAGGGSYGPFQLYTKGALPAQYRGKPQLADAWAWSPQGIDYALGKMAAVGAGGLTGASAVERIIRHFEKPENPDLSVSKALARLGQGGSAGNTGASLPMTGALRGGANPSTPLQTHLSTPSGTSQDPRRKFLLQGLAQGQDIYDLIGQMAFMPVASPVRPVQPAGGPPMPQTAPSTPLNATGDPGGFIPEFQKRLNRMIADSGGRLKITSGYRSYDHQARLYADALKKYGSEQAARKWVAPPGKSNHGKGMAADLAGDLDWAHRNARKYGLYFPMAHEKWHVELVGSRG